jgi:hypothetical protein
MNGDDDDCDPDPEQMRAADGTMKRFCNNMCDFSIGYNVVNGLSVCEDVSLKQISGHVTIGNSVPIARKAAHLLLTLSRKTREESNFLHTSYSTQMKRLISRTTSVLQKHQQHAIEEYGFIPIYKGPFAGLCLSNDGEI